MEEAWSENESDIFIKYGKSFVPYREKQIEIICDLALPINLSTSNPCIVDLCCGQGLLTEALLEKHPNVHVIALDASPTMLQEVETRLVRFKDRLEVKLFDLNSSNWRQFSKPIDAFVSSLAIHHLDANEKKALFVDLNKALKPKGAFLIADLILPLSAESLLVAAKNWNEITKDHSLEFEGNLSAFDMFCKLEWNYFNYPSSTDKPSSLLDQLKWLEIAGFKNVEAFWIFAGHAIYGGYK